jgi:hypothetical protein
VDKLEEALKDAGLVVTRSKIPDCLTTEPFGPLEKGDILTLGDKGTPPLGRIKVIGVPMETNRRVGSTERQRRVRTWPAPPEKRKTGYYYFRNIDMPFKGKIGCFFAFYTGTALGCLHGNSTTVFNIVDVKRASG